MSSNLVKKYAKLEKLGEGSYARVFKARNTEDNTLVAIKKIKINFSHGDDCCGINPTTLREIRFLKSIQHPYIIKLLEVIGDCLKISLIIDYMEGDLRDIIFSRTIAISQAQIKCYMTMMVDAVSFMHSRWILHRDLKPENILISPDGTIRITDFGLARIFGHYSNIEMTSNVVTRWYRSPELLYGSTMYGEGVDVWALGCIFAELFLKAPLFPGDSDLAQLNEIFEKLGTPDETTWPGISSLPDYVPYKKKNNIIPFSGILTGVTKETLNFLSSMLQVTPAKRISSANMIKCKYFKENPPCASFHQLPKIQRESAFDKSNNNELIGVKKKLQF